MFHMFQKHFKLVQKIAKQKVTKKCLEIFQSVLKNCLLEKFSIINSLECFEMICLEKAIQNVSRKTSKFFYPFLNVVKHLRMF